MKMKKLLAILLAIASVMTLTLCLSSCKKDKKEDDEAAVKQYTVKFDANGGDITSGKSEYKADEGSVYSSFISAVPEVSLENAEFAGWFAGETAYDPSGKLTADITFTAKWNYAFTVTFDANGGEFAEGAVTEFSVLDSQTLADAIEATPEVSRNGYLFDGWYCGEEEYDDGAAVTEDTVYTAAWSAKDGVMTTERLQGTWYTTVDMMTTLEASDIVGLPTGFDSDAELSGYFEFDGDKVTVYATEEDLIEAAGPYLDDLTDAMSDDVDFTYSALMQLYNVNSKSKVEEKIKEDAGLPFKLSGKALQIAVVEYIKSVDADDLIGDIVDSEGRYVLLDSVTYTVDPDNYTIDINGDTVSLGRIEADSFKITDAEGACAGYKGAVLERQ